MKPRTKRSTESESGQATIEFALTLIFLVGVVFFYFQVALLSAYGNYVHYATFMAARAYLAAGGNQAQQEERAKQVLREMLKRPGSSRDRWPGVAKAVDDGASDLAGATIGPLEGAFDENDRAKSWLEGVRYRFRGPLFLSPFGGGAAVNSLELESESWLGREPSQQECVSDLEERVGRVVIDNGC